MKHPGNVAPVLFGCALFVILGIFFYGNPNIEDLKFIEGEVRNVILKETRPGAYVEVESKYNDEVVMFNIENISEHSNRILRGIAPGDVVKVWYSDRVPMRHGSAWAWQLENKGDLVLSFHDTKKEHDAFRYFFWFIFLIFLLSGLWFFYKSKVNAQVS